MFEYKPSDKHEKYQLLLDDYLAKVDRQEAALVEAGLPAEGLAEFIRTWFEAWLARDVRKLRQCINGDIVYTDTSTNGREFTWGRDDDLVWALIYKFLAPDLAFYPQNDTAAALPYYDFLDGVVRVSIPWRGIARARFLPMRPIENVGVDRYVMARVDGAWRIDRADVDWDALGALLQILPIRLLYPSQRSRHVVLTAFRRFAPGVVAGLGLDEPLPQLQPATQKSVRATGTTQLQPATATKAGRKAPAMKRA